MVFGSITATFGLISLDARLILLCWLFFFYYNNPITVPGPHFQTSAWNLPSKSLDFTVCSPLQNWKQIPICLVGTLWAFWEPLSNLTMRHIENIFQKSIGFLSQICSKFAHNTPKPLIKNSFIKYPKMCLQCRVYSNVLKENSQCSPILSKILNKLSEYVAGYIVDFLYSILWKNSWWVA